MPKLLVLLSGGLVLRLALLPQVSSGRTAAIALAWGVLADAGLALLAGQPPWSPRRAWVRWALRAFALLQWLAWPLWLMLQYFYFSEFGTRPDQIVLDYIFYTGEVTGNVWESYPVVPLAAACVALALLVTWFVGRKRSAVTTRWRVGQAVLGVGLFAGSLFVSPPIADRTVRELARNGFATLLQAALTGELDYASYYKTLPGSIERLREQQRRDPEFAKFTDCAIRRRVTPAGPPQDLNVVLILAESLGRELTADGAGAKSLTPNFDRLAGEGLLFTRFYATGTRTARALEGALASFPPIPGNAIVRLQRQRPVDTLATVLGARGYRTSFVYGGRLGFDNMGAFLAANGFEERIENAGRDAPDAFTTSWGAADEFAFDRVLAEMRRARQDRKPLFLTVLTVSNHRPFQFPAGRVEGAQRTREGAVRYADWALGRFLDAARREGFDRDTLFAIVGDHGPRSYTREKLPADAHRVPFLLWGSEGVRGRNAVIGSTIDVAPTLLGVLGREYEASFYGRNLLRVTDGGWALIQDKRDLGLITPEGMTVIGFSGRDEFIPLDASDARGAAQPFAGGDAREALGIALFQSAYELYSGEGHRPASAAPGFALGD